MSIIGKNKKAHAAFLISATLSAVFLLPFCDFIYKCGCTFPWAGADELCNVRLANVPHCPWCEPRNPVVMALPFMAIFGGQGLAIYHFHNSRSASTIRLLLIGLLTFVILGFLNGLIFKLADDYPHFFLN